MKENIQIVGGKKLHGKIATNTSKNGALALIATTLLNHGTTNLHFIPKNEEVLRLLEVLTSLGVSCKWQSQNGEPDILVVNRPEKLDLKNLNVDVFVKIRVGLYLIPILLHESSRFQLPNPGGCKMGERTISAHRFALENFGVGIKSKATEYDISYKAKKATDKSVREVVMYESSDTGAVNTLLMAALTPGTTTILFAPPNYQVQDVCFALNKMGVEVEGVGTTTLVVKGTESINMTLDLYNSEDPIESMLFLSIAAVTQSHLVIKRSPIEFLKLELLKLEKMGLKFKLSKEFLSHNGKTRLVNIEVFPSTFTALRDKIHPSAFPGLNVDNLPFFVPVAVLAKGNTLIHDWMWENRAIYFTELNRLGADVKLADPHRVFITGPTKLKGNSIVCPPALRPATIILVAMLAAEGTSTLYNIYSIRRGYENLVERLSELGADIKYI
jgi:UDP-N-acetylglucosamine 1-carboxyvinyltransferase